MSEEYEKKLASILEKPMNRRQFLQHIGLVVLGIFGINKFIGLILDPHNYNDRKADRGWGNGRFGK